MRIAVPTLPVSGHLNPMTALARRLKLNGHQITMISVPFVDPAIRAPVDFPWTRLTGAPLVYALMGTLENGIQDVFRAITEVATRRKQLQFVIATGRNVDLTPLLPAPENVIFVEYAPQHDLLKRASIGITHGGLNTTLEALSEGVPLVAISVTNDRPGVAARIRQHRLGDFVPFSELSERRLGDLVDRYLPTLHIGTMQSV